MAEVYFISVLYFSGRVLCTRPLPNERSPMMTARSKSCRAPLRISDTFESFLTRLVAVDFLTEDQGKYQTRAAADKEFDDLCERYHEGNGECRVRTGRFMR